jgi:hypothetical protein
MPFLAQFSRPRSLFLLLRLGFGTAVNVIALNYVSASAMEKNDADVVDAILLMLCFLGTMPSCTMRLKKVWLNGEWRQTLCLAFALFNFYYFWKIYICSIPIPGVM